MVSVSTMLAGLALSAATAQANSLSALPTFDVPAFDYPSIAQGENPARLLQALQTDGIIALRNIPNYANLRERYLRTAAECAGVTANVDHDMFVSRKLFDDGTKRYTISTNAGRELSGSAMEVDTTCPGYRQLYEEFSQTLEHAVNTFGSTLDQTSFTASDGQRSISSRQLVSDAVRLDHFHAYEAVPSGPASAGVDGIHRQLEELSLPLHEDHGLFIAMSAPKFFDVGADRRLVERELSESASGLVIQTASGSRVRPVLKNDEVVIMMGTGASRWLQTSHSIPAVMHGMKMPEGSENGVRSLRAWFGKMTLLPAYQRMLLSNGVSFEAHSNATTRFLLANQEDDLKTVGCATGRRLMASEGKCTLRVCKTKSGASAPAEGCSTICNRKNHSPDDETNCTKSCDCSDSSSPAERCWMLCVANLDTNSCPSDKQTCTGQAITCTVPLSTPAPVTTTPAPVPTTTQPGPTPTPGPGSPTPTPAPGPGPTNTNPSPSPGSPSSSPSPSTPGSTPNPSSSKTPSPSGSKDDSSTPIPTVTATDPTSGPPGSSDTSIESPGTVGTGSGSADTPSTTKDSVSATDGPVPSPSSGFKLAFSSAALIASAIVATLF